MCHKARTEPYRMYFALKLSMLVVNAMIGPHTPCTTVREGAQANKISLKEHSAEL